MLNNFSNHFLVPRPFLFDKMILRVSKTVKINLRDDFSPLLFGAPAPRVPRIDFVLFRAYIFGVMLRPGKGADSQLASYPCLLTNKCGAVCGQQCDPFGHGARLPPALLIATMLETS